MLTPEYQSEINARPILDNQRAMACTIQFMIDNALEGNKMLCGLPSQQEKALERFRGSLGKYWRECRTVTADFGRQTGKTTWIARTATDEDVVVVHNSSFRTRFLEMCAIAPHRVLTFREIVDRKFHPFETYPIAEFKRCFIDGAGYMGRDEIMSIYARLGRHYPKSQGMACQFFLL